MTLCSGELASLKAVAQHMTVSLRTLNRDFHPCQAVYAFPPPELARSLAHKKRRHVRRKWLSSSALDAANRRAFEADLKKCNLTLDNHRRRLPVVTHLAYTYLVNMSSTCLADLP